MQSWQRTVLAWFLGVLFVAGGAWGVIADASEPQYGGTLKVTMTTYPDSFDQTYSTSIVAMLISKHVMETPFALDSSAIPQPQLVDTYSVSDDATEYTFHLREGVRFHNGQEMTAEDVVASLERWGNLSSRGRTNFEHLDALEAVDPYTVRMTFTEPNATLTGYLVPNLTAASIILPADIARAHYDEEITDLDQLVGTGPYRITAVQPDVQITLERFDDYVPVEREPDGWSGRRTAYLDEIHFIIMPDAMTRLSSLEVGEVHFAADLPPDEYDYVSAHPNLQVHIAPPERYPFLLFNQHRGLLASREMRQAIQAAFNMEDIMLGGFGPSALWDLDPGLGDRAWGWWTDAGGELYNQNDPDRARELLEAAGYDGEPIVWLVAGERVEHSPPTVVAVDQLERIGLNIDLQVTDWATHVALRGDPENWDIATTAGGTPVHPVLGWEVQPDWPIEQRIVNQTVRDNLEILRAEPDFDRARQIWEETQREIYEDVVLIWFGNFGPYQASLPEVQDYWPARYPFFWNVWLDQ